MNKPKKTFKSPCCEAKCSAVCTSGALLVACIKCGETVAGAGALTTPPKRKYKQTNRKHSYYTVRPKNEELTPDTMTYADHLAKMEKKKFFKKLISKNESP